MSRKSSSQMKSFKEAARELGCSEDESEFDKALAKLAQAPPPKSVEKRKAKKSEK